MSSGWTWSPTGTGTSNSAYGNFPVLNANISETSAAMANQGTPFTPNSPNQQFQKGQPVAMAAPAEVYANPNAAGGTSEALPVNSNLVVLPQQDQFGMNFENPQEYQQQPQGSVEYLTGAEAEAVVKQIPNFPYAFYPNQNQSQGFHQTSPANPAPGASGVEAGGSRNGGGEGANINNAQRKNQKRSTTGAGAVNKTQQSRNRVNPGAGSTLRKSSHGLQTPKTKQVQEQQSTNAAEIARDGAGEKKVGAVGARTAGGIRHTRSQPQFYLPRILPSYESPPFVRPAAPPLALASANPSEPVIPTLPNNQNQKQPKQRGTMSQIRRASQKPSFNLCGKCSKCKMISENPASLPAFYQKQSSAAPFNVGAMGRQSSAIVFPDN